MEQEIEKKIKDLKDFIKQKTDQGTANYLVKEIREICGMVETEALSQHDVIKNEVAVCEHSETENLYCDVGWAIEGKRCKKCKQTVL
jgi:hypothetical protein